MIEWSLDAFRVSESVVAIVVAVPPGFDHQLGREGGGVAASGLTVVDGGATRAESVANALAVVETELVAIHDAARPLLTPSLVDDLVAELETDAGAIAAIAASPVTDTVKESKCAFVRQERNKAHLEVERTVDRSRLWAAQTPQVFRTAALRDALAVDEATRDAATDEAMLVEAGGGRVLIHPSAGENLKVTTLLDLKLAELLFAERGSVPE